ncbi:MAG: hypothetical protein LKE37_08810 [Atopobiaceae bacterium]|jgi:hypothetical protein|nr:hypothetical protein [Atopobiaceae bacterium]
MVIGDKGSIESIFSDYLNEYEATTIEEQHELLNRVDASLFSTTYEYEWSRYNQAICESVMKMVRYEASLRAWSATLAKYPREQCEMLKVDFVMPVLHLACELPLMVKDEIVHGASTLSYLASNEDRDLAALENVKQGGWQDLFSREVRSRPEGKELSEKVDALWESDGAKRLRNRHGATQHDVYPDLINTRPLAWEDGNGVTFFGIEEPIDLGNEIEAMSAQRIVAQEAYREFHRFASKLHDEMPPTMP